MKKLLTLSLLVLGTVASSHAQAVECKGLKEEGLMLTSTSEQGVIHVHSYKNANETIQITIVSGSSDGSVTIHATDKEKFVASASGINPALHAIVSGEIIGISCK